MCIELMHTYIGGAVQHNERIIPQVNLVDLIEDLLARCRIRYLLLLPVQFIQVGVAIESNVKPGRWELVTSEN